MIKIKSNPIVYFEEDDCERITNNENWGKILDMTPHVNVRGYVEWIDLETEKAPAFGGRFCKYWIGYQKSFKVRLRDGQEFEFKGTVGDITDDMEFNREFLRFAEDFHNGQYEACSKLQVTSEVEFMDIWLERNAELSFTINPELTIL